MDKRFAAVSLSVLILSSAVTGYAQEVDPLLSQKHYQTLQVPVLIQLSDQSYLLSVANAGNAKQEIGKPPLSGLRITGEILFGTLGGFGGMILGMLVPQLAAAGIGTLTGIEDPSDDAVEMVEAVEVVMAITGWVMGSTVGVYKLGSRDNETGSFWTTTLGAVTGVGAVVVAGIIVEAINGDEDAAGLLFALAVPPIGATIAFNKTRRYRTPPAEPETALINFRDGQMSLAFPRIYFRPDSFGRGNPSRSVDLLRVRFWIWLMGLFSTTYLKGDEL